MTDSGRCTGRAAPSPDAAPGVSIPGLRGFRLTRYDNYGWEGMRIMEIRRPVKCPKLFHRNSICTEHLFLPTIRWGGHPVRGSPPPSRAPHSEVEALRGSRSARRQRGGQEDPGRRDTNGLLQEAYAPHRARKRRKSCAPPADEDGGALGTGERAYLQARIKRRLMCCCMQTYRESRNRATGVYPMRRISRQDAHVRARGCTKRAQRIGNTRGTSRWRRTLGIIQVRKRNWGTQRNRETETMLLLCSSVSV